MCGLIRRRQQPYGYLTNSGWLGWINSDQAFILFDTEKEYEEAFYEDLGGKQN